MAAYAQRRYPVPADGAEDIGAFITLISRLAGPGSTLGPLANLATLLAILLTEAHLVLEPDFNLDFGLGFWRNVFDNFAQRFSKFGDARQINAPPTHEAIFFEIRTSFGKRGDLDFLLRQKLWRPAI